MPHKIDLSVIFLCFLVLLFLASCDTGSDLLPEPSNKECQRAVIRNQFIVSYQDGGYELVSKEKLRDRRENPKKKVRQISYNYRTSPRSMTPRAHDFAFSAEEIRRKLGLPSANLQGFRGQGIIVAVIDSGVQIDHPELRNYLFFNEKENSFGNNGIDDDLNGFIDDRIGWNFPINSGELNDESGHGTAIAGTISGSGLTSLSLAPGSRILPVDFISTDGGTEFHAVQATNYALSQGAHIINNSWSVACSEALQMSFRDWSGLNVIFVNASGNSPVNVTKEGIIPSSFSSPNFLNVGSIDLFGRRSDFSGFGPTVKIYAPGEMIPVLALSPTPDQKTSSGTSLSAAVVSGGVALLWSAFPHLSAREIVELVIAGADRDSGLPILNIEKAIKFQNRSPPPQEQPDRH